MFSKYKAATVLVVAVCIQTCSALFALAEDNVNKDWILNVQTEELKRQFDYHKSELRDITKVTVEYFHENNPGDVRPYERVYYNNGKPVGMERTGTFGLTPVEIAAIKVSHTRGTASKQEEKAVANILWRLSLNATHNDNQLVAALVPAQSFDGVAQALKDIGFGPAQQGGAERATEAKCLLNLETYPSGRSQKLYYY